MFDLGSVYPASINVFDSSGNAANASSVTLTITLPDGTSASPGVTNPPAVTGQYTYPFQTTMPGRHTVRWVTTSPNTGYTDVFDVAEAMSPAIISLADAKQQLGYQQSNTTDDAELRAKLYACTKAIENYKHEVIAPRVMTEEQMIGGFWWRQWPAPFGGNARLTNVPIIQLLSIATSDGKATWDPNNFDLDNDTGILGWVNGPPLTGRITFQYMAGYQIIPYNYIEGTKVLLQAMWETRRGPGGASGVIGPEEMNDYRHYTAMPRKVTEWIGPPRPVVM